MIATASGINAAGTSGYVQFYLQESSLTGTDGWTFQVDPTGTGNSYVTRLSDSTFAQNNQGWQKYQYTLTSSELVSGAEAAVPVQRGRLRRYRPDLPGRHHRHVTSGGTATTTVTMYDDGAHGDGAAGDRVYGAQIPPRPPAPR